MLLARLCTCSSTNNVIIILYSLPTHHVIFIQPTNKRRYILYSLPTDDVIFYTTHHKNSSKTNKTPTVAGMKTKNHTISPRATLAEGLLLVCQTTACLLEGFAVLSDCCWSVKGTVAGLSKRLLLVCQRDCCWSIRLLLVC